MPLFYFIIFCAISIVELYAEMTQNSILRLISKPMIMIWLIYFFYRSVNKKSKLFYIFLAAFVFAWLGDVSLLFTENGQIYFLLGLGSFLITHILYIIGFKKGTSISFSPLKIILSILILVYGFFLLKNVWAGLGDMQIAVIIYATAICLMVIMALLSDANFVKSAYTLILIGAFLFMVSDSLIAVNKFGVGIEKAPVLIMSTYITAQFYIVLGVVNRLSLKESYSD